MSVEENLPDLPTDLILQIFSRLPAKSVARFRCLSKLWASLLTLGSPYFTELFMTRSITRPRLLFVVGRDYDWCLYSCPQGPQPQTSYKNPKQPLSVTAEFHMFLPRSNSFVHLSPLVSGLMYLYNRPDLNSPTLCNPSTGQLLSLPQVARAVQSYFGYDPINKQFSVLAICCHPCLPSQVYQILKLGYGRLSWRSLNCPSHHYLLKVNICINGILYYMAWLMSYRLPHKIASFDLNSEEFKFIDQPWHDEPELFVNFKGKLGGIKTKTVVSEKRSHLEMSLWVLEDAVKQKWSKHVHNILLTELWNEEDEPYRILGVTGKGDIVLALCYTTDPFYVYFFNLEKKTLQKVVIKGFEGFKSQRLYGCVDYTEELKALKWN